MAFGVAEVVGEADAEGVGAELGLVGTLADVPGLSDALGAGAPDVGAVFVGAGLVAVGLGVVGFGVGLGVGFGGVGAAGGAMLGFCPEPKRNPRTVPGAGL